MNTINTIPSINFSTIEMFKTDVPKIFLLDVTPEIATEMLSTSSGNRKLNTPNICNLKAEMTNGEYDWRTGETIKFNNNGVLKDGHHRLKAVIESGTTQTMLVFIGAVKSEKMDTGKSRSMADSLVMSDNGEYNSIAKLAVNILRLKNGYPLSNVGYKKEIPLTDIITLCKTEKEELEQIVNDLKSFKENWIKKYNKTEPSVIGAIIYDMVYNKGYDYDEVALFTEQIFSMETSRNPIINAFRKSALKDSSKTSKSGAWTFEEFRTRFADVFEKQLKAKKRYAIA